MSQSDPSHPDTISLRDQLSDADDVLTEAQERLDHVGSAARQMIAEMLARINVEIQQQPQISVVRPACIALHNLVVTLRTPRCSVVALRDEMRTVRLSLRKLLSDPLFGISPEFLEAGVRRALGASKTTLSVCGHRQVRLRFAKQVLRPFPDDPALPNDQLPIAVVTCSRCGCMTTYDLAALGVLPRRSRSLPADSDQDGQQRTAVRAVPNLRG